MKRLTVLAAALTSALAALAQTLVLAPGNGIETNVTDRIDGDVTVQINDGSSGGGIVRLSNEWNQYAGDTRILCGTLEPSVIRETHLPSALGRNASAPQTLYVGNGTFRYAGQAAESSRRLVIDHPWVRHASVLDIVGDIAFTGGTFSNNGSILKTGAGTLTLDQPDGDYQMTTRSDGFEYAKLLPTSFSANGDSPENIYETGSLTILEGRLAIKGSSMVTNRFALGCTVDPKNASHGTTYIGKASADGEERAGHLDIYGGWNHFGELIRFDASNGYRTAVNSSLNIYGGTALACFVYLGDAKGEAAATCPELNVYDGGEMKVQYLHLSASKGSKSRLNVAGGKVSVGGAIYIANESAGSSVSDPLLPTAEICVSSNGMLIGNLQIGLGGYSDLAIRLASGGTYQLWGGINTTGGRIVVEGDGGTLRSSSEATFKNTSLRVGTGGLTLAANQALTFPGAVENASETPGVLTVACPRAIFLGAMTFTGDIVAEESRSLVFGGDVPATVTLNNGTLSASGQNVSIASLKHGLGAIPTFAFAASGDSVNMLNLANWAVPGSVNVTLTGVVSGKTYDLMTCPADCGVSAGTFVATSVNDSLSATFTVVISGDTATVRATVGPAPVVLVDGGTRTWSNAAGGDWAADANWSEGTTPADNARTAISFPVASAGEKTSVALNKAAAVSGLAFDAAPGYKVSGSGSIDVHKSGAAVVSSKSGTNAVDTVMTYSGSLRLASQLGSRLELTTLEGRGDVQLNDGGSGAATGLSGLGAVVIKNALVNGSLTERNGLLEVGTMGPGVSALSIGYGLFRYTGGDYTLNGSLTASPNNWSQAQIEIVNSDATFTVAGSVTQTDGGFTKRGKGKLVFDGIGDHLLSNASLHKYNFSDSGYASHNNVWGVNGLSPIDGSGQAQSFFGLSCAGGTLCWGKEGQKLTVRGGDLVVGTTTTASPGCEYDAAAEINGGETIVDSGDIVISYNHGNSKKNTAEKDRLTARLTVNDGVVSAGALTFAKNDWCASTVDAIYHQKGGSVNVAKVNVGTHDAGNSTATFIMDDGRFDVSGDFLIVCGMQPNGARLKQATVTVNGGLLNVSGNLYVGNGTWNKPVVVMNLNGGKLRIKNAVRMLYGSATVNLNEGGVLESSTFEVHGSYVDKAHCINWNGGRYQGVGTSPLVNGWKTLTIGEKGAWLDTSEMTGGKLYFRNAVTSAAGAIHVCGANPMRPVAFDDVSIGMTPVVVEPGGSAFAYSTACASASATVCGGGAFGSRWTSAAGGATEVKSLTLGVNSSDRAMLYFTTGSGFITPVKVNEAFALNGAVEVAVMNNEMTAYETLAFSGKPILIAPKGSIDAAKFIFTSRTPTVKGEFAVSAYDDTYDQLKLTTTVDASVDNRKMHVWTSGNGGNWTDGQNWDVPPADHASDKVSFTSYLAGSKTVALGGERTVGFLSSAAQDLTLASGALKVASEAGYAKRIETTAGTLTLPAVKTDAGELTLATAAGSTQVVSQAISTPAPATAVVLNPASGSGTVRIAAPQNGQAFSLSSGTLEGPASAFDGGQVKVKNATLRLTESGFVKSPVASADSLLLKTDEDVWFMSDVSAKYGFIKSGAGTAYLGGAGAVTLGSCVWNRNVDWPQTLPANGDLPEITAMNQNACQVIAGRLVLGLNPEQKIGDNKFGFLFVGTRFVEFDEAGNLLQPELDIRGGTITLPSIRMGERLGDYRRLPGNAAKIMRPTLSVYGGTVEFGGLYLGANDGDVNSVNTLNLYGGTMRSSDQWIAFGYGRTTYQPEYGQAKSIVNIYGGILELTNPTDNVGEISKMNGDAELNIYGGEMSYAGRCHVTGVRRDTKVDIRLAGGRLTATRLTCADLAGNETGGYRNLIWNGGTFRPRESGALANNWTANTVAEGGAAFDLSLIGATGGVYTVNAPFTHAGTLLEDGGVALKDETGGGTLVLAVANDMTGPVAVYGGTVRPAVAGAVPGGLVLGGGVFDCNTFDFSVPYLRGAGGAATNGIVTVRDAMAPLAEASTNGLYAVVDHLVFGNGCTVSCPVTEVEDALVAPYFRVEKSCSGYLSMDFARTEENPLPYSMRVKIAELAPGVASFPLLHAVNTGLRPSHAVAREIEYDQATGVATVYAIVKPAATLIIVR